nr:MAG TPA: Carbamoyl-phosphate synthetase large chain, oligomerization domain [Caudoviricetes sp.]
MLDERTREIFDTLYKQGYSDKKIAEHTYYTYDTIRAYRRHLGLKSNLQKKLDRRMELYEQGLSDGQIAAEIGFSKSCVRGWRIANNLPINRSHKNGNYTYTEDVKLEIASFALVNPNVSLNQISKEFGASKTSIRKILNEKGIKTIGMIEHEKKRKGSVKDGSSKVLN